MPEGPEVKTVARTLAKELMGKKFSSLWHSNFSLRKTVDYNAFRIYENLNIDEVSCYGKIIFIRIDKKTALMAQLGMTGQLVVLPKKAPLAPHTHIRWQLIGTDKELRYIDPRRFGVFSLCNDAAKQTIIKKLGPDPFTMTKKDHQSITSIMKKSKRTIKAILLDQSVIAGVGNIYASEALFLAKLSPKKSGTDISADEYERLIVSVIQVLKLGYKNCGTTFSNYVDGSGKKGDNLQFVKVFQRENQPCAVCNNLIKRMKQNGRSTFYCPHCQNDKSIDTIHSELS